jgi:hypothetical protein
VARAPGGACRARGGRAGGAGAGGVRHARAQRGLAQRRDALARRHAEEPGQLARLDELRPHADGARRLHRRDRAVREGARAGAVLLEPPRRSSTSRARWRSRPTTRRATSSTRATSSSTAGAGRRWPSSTGWSRAARRISARASCA